MLILDTNILIFYLNGSLTKREYRVMSSNEWAVSDIVLWEIAMLSSRQRITFDLETTSTKEFLHECKILPITPAIAMQSTKLDFHSDPADEIIAATSIIHRIPLMTRDKKILKSKMILFA